ncbi:MAG TPA: hypothetical protein VE035_16510, partial [Puia sp.]|nr:hypothetical protein [Puia sp.]
MRSFFLFLAALSLSAMAFSQKEIFDLASFTPPRGWQRIDSNGIILFQKANTSNGQLTRFAQIFLFPSQPSSGEPMKDFNAEWNYRVVKSTGIRENPRPASQKNPDGWTQTSGQANITQQGITYTCTLVSLSGFGKEMSFIINAAGQDYNDEVLVFFKNLDMRNPIVTGDLWSPKNKPPESNTTNGGTANTAASTRPGTLSDYIYIPPQGWAMQQFADGILLSATPRGSENCSLTLFQMRATGNNIFSDADRIFSETFNKYEP